MKADGKKSENTALPVAVMSEVAVTNIVSFVDDKLTIKQAPVKDKTLRAFPFRASASAFLTASVACAFLLSFVLIGAKSMTNQAPVANDIVITETENTGVGFVEDLFR